jgi:hypothetical protein
MSTRYGVNEFDEIAKGLKDIEAAKLERINGVPIEDAQPVKAPEDIDWTGMYGYPAGYTTAGLPTHGHTYSYMTGGASSQSTVYNGLPPVTKWIDGKEYKVFGNIYVCDK